MTAADRLRWIARGSPFRLMTPAAALRDILRSHGYTVYDIGNKQHLEAEPPEDHTPYSETGYPGRAQYGVGYAIDIMPPAGSDLPSLARVGAQLLADRRAGVAGISWLKYMNWEPGDGSCWQDSWRPNYARRASTDRGHIHLSGLTGFENSTVGAGYDPVARIRGDEMTPEQERMLRATNERVRAMAAGLTSLPTTWAADPRAVEPVGLVRQLTRIEAGLVQLSGRDLVDEEEIVQGVLTGLGHRSVEDVARALMAAGQDPVELAAALTALAAPQE